MDANIEAMQGAMKDELFLADLHKVMDDFRDADAQTFADEILFLPIGDK